MTTEERLEKVERELARAKRRNRWQAAFIGLAVVGLILAWTLTKIAPAVQSQEDAEATKPVQVIRATAFVLVDDEGRERGKLEMLKNGPELRLIDANGESRIMLSTYKFKDAKGLQMDGTGLCLADENGKARAWLRLEKFGPSEDVGCYDWESLYLFDEKGEEGVNLMVNKGGSGLDLHDKNGVYRAGLSVGVDYAVLQLHDDDVRYGHATRQRARLSVDKDGPSLGLFDENGNIRARLHETPGGAMLDLRDEKNEYRAWLYGGKTAPALGLIDLNKEAGATLDLSPFGPWLRLFDKNRSGAWLRVTKDGPVMSLRDAAGKPIWSAP
ncbi:MAG TPA: hypothetical protein VMY35_17955 [Phycisphaerae bacterium]|nr:hypothetical protein [Phycisphaerae bacterium]